MTAHSAQILVIGAGMAGLACAQRLHDAGRHVILLDKGRGPGGRMASRRIEVCGETIAFDHGAQYFTAKEPEFAAEVARWQASGWAARWEAAGAEAWVGVPGMNGVLRGLAGALDVRWGVRAEVLEREGELWVVTAGEEQFTAPALIIAVPAEQAAVLLESAAPVVAGLARAITSAPCWAMMAAFSAPLAVSADLLCEPSADLSWAARNSAKPGRGGKEAWVVHASAARSLALIDATRETVAEALLADFFAAAAIRPQAPLHCDAHRWLYAFPDPVAGQAARYDPDLRLGLAGDWLVAPKVEGAWLSGSVLAEAVLEAPATAR